MIDFLNAIKERYLIDFKLLVDYWHIWLILIVIAFGIVLVLYRRHYYKDYIKRKHKRNPEK